jgi:hypothetical protein
MAHSRRAATTTRLRLLVLEDRTVPSSFHLVATGSDVGAAPVVNVYNANSHELLASITAYDRKFLGGARVATGDVTGDGIDDVVVAPGAGATPHVEVFDGKDLLVHKATVVANFYAYAPNFTSGVNVAVGQIDPNTKALEIVTGADAGGGPHVRTFAVANGTATPISGPLGSFFAYAPTFTGGVRVATADLNRDGTDEIVTGAGPGGGPHVEAFKADGSRMVSFYAYDPHFTGGVYVAAGVVTNTSTNRDIVTGAGPGGAPTVKVFEIDPTTGKQSLIASFFAGDPRYPDSKGGVRVAVGGMWIAGAYAVAMVNNSPPPPNADAYTPFDLGPGQLVPSYDGPDSPHDIFASPATADRTSGREFWLDTTVGSNGQTRHSAHLLWSSVTHDPKSTGGTFVG